MMNKTNCTVKNPFITCLELCINANLTKNKLNLFVLSGHGSESFAAFLNGVILQTKKTRQLSL